MIMKVFILLTTYALVVVYGNDVKRKDNVESYITKEAAKELNKLSFRGEQQDQDYDEYLRKVILSVQQPEEDESNEDNEKKVMYEKKYFDYLPNDLDSEYATGEDSTHELVKPFGEFVLTELDADARRANNKKLKRVRRQSIFRIPLIHQSPYPNYDFYFPQDYAPVPFRSYYAPPNYPLQPNIAARKFPLRSDFATISTQNPWLKPTGRPLLPARAYLPAENNPLPPDNQGDVKDDFPNRGIFEEDDSDLRVWPNNYENKKGGFIGNSIVPTTRPVQQVTTTTPRPIRPVENDIDQDLEVEIEYPPNIFDDDRPLTTRAPLTIPTSSSNKSPNRNPNRKQNRNTQRPATAPPQNPTGQQNRQSSSNSREQKSVSACALAIVNCCSRHDDFVRLPCFEKYNCSGMFFGQSPCSANIKASALRELEKYVR